MGQKRLWALLTHFFYPLRPVSYTHLVSQRTALSRYRSLGGTIFMTVMVMIGPRFL